VTNGELTLSADAVTAGPAAAPEYGGGGMNGDDGPFFDDEGVVCIGAAIAVFVSPGVKQFGAVCVAIPAPG